MHFTQPTKKLLWVTWGLLMVLTAATMFGGHADSQTSAPIGPLWVAGVLVLTIIKSRQILSVYLNLRASTFGWRTFFLAFILVIALSILAPYWAATL